MTVNFEVKQYILQFQPLYTLVSTVREGIGLRKEILFDASKQLIYLFNYENKLVPQASVQPMRHPAPDYTLEKVPIQEEVAGFPCQKYKITRHNAEGLLLTQYAWYSARQPFFVNFPKEWPDMADDIPIFVERIPGFPRQIDMPFYHFPLAAMVKNPYAYMGLVLTLKEIKYEAYPANLFALPKGLKK
ncbi:MAG: hypothetical protein OHK0053_29460 [Microscillaceae bacterium]